MPSLPHLASACAALCLLGACQAPVPKPTPTPDGAGVPVAPPAATGPVADTSDSSDAAVDPDTLPAINCGEGRMAKLMNMPESEEAHAAVIAAVGHRHIRWVHPGDAVTMDYQPGRLNVIVDEHGQIAATRCG